MDLSKAAWRKSSYTTSNGGECVELASFPSAVAVRDSKDPDGPNLVVTRRAFAALLDGIKGRASSASL
ncbi:toxin [Actinomadura cremea]|nr:toxin [Actinomadura cremea]